MSKFLLKEKHKFLIDSVISIKMFTIFITYQRNS